MIVRAQSHQHSSYLEPLQSFSDPYNEEQAKGLVRSILDAVAYMHRYEIFVLNLARIHDLICLSDFFPSLIKICAHFPLRSHEIIHRDLKYENIMFATPESSAVKIIDFGLSKKYAYEEHLHDAVGTVYTMAPEVS